MDREDSLQKKLLAFIVVSLLLHLILVLWFYQMPLIRFDESKAPQQAPEQEVVFVKPQDFPPPAAAPQNLPLADIAKPKVEQVPDKARVASQYNSKVKEETVARKIPKKADPNTDISDDPKVLDKPRQGDRPAKPEKKVAKQAPTRRPPVKEPKPSMETPEAKSDLGKRGQTSKGVSLADLQIKPTDMPELLGDEGKSELAREPEFGDRKTLSEDEERIVAALPRDRGSSGLGDRFVHDFMPGIKIGDKTYLNAASMPNVQYFTRLKRVFRLRFNPRDPLLSHFRHNSIVKGKINVTMAVEVAPSGQLKRLFVLRSSGIPGYDQEALRTIRQSAPFSAPPKKIQGKDGILRMTWHFTTFI